MAIYRSNQITGELEQLTDRQIKKEIQDLTGWDTKQYQKEYDKFRNRIRNYEAVIGSVLKRPNEEFLRIIRKQETGWELNARQQGILSFTTSGTNTFKKQLQSGKVNYRLNEIATNAVIGEFKGLLEKSQITRTAYENWLDEVIGQEPLKDNKGRIIKDLTNKPIMVDILRSSRVTPQEINKFLSGQAKDLHRRQAAELASNEAYYKTHKRKANTD